MRKLSDLKSKVLHQFSSTWEFVSRLRLAIKPDSTDAHLALGHALMQQQKYKAAIDAYEKALALEPNRLETQQFINHAKKHFKRHAQGSQSQISNSIPPLENTTLQATIQTSDHLLDQAKRLVQQEKVQDAIDVYQKVIEQFPSLTAEISIQIAYLQCKKRWFSGAFNYYLSAISSNPELEHIHAELASTLSEQHNSIVEYMQQVEAKGYQFTQDWFSSAIASWKRILDKFRDREIKVLEIGSWEGRSVCWLVDHILTHPNAKITCIDNWEYPSTAKLQIFGYAPNYLESEGYQQSSWRQAEQLFDDNMIKTGTPEKIEKLVGSSYELMRLLPLNSYDFIYIDGSHLASDVLMDAVLAWGLLKVGGLLFFDDYYFSFPNVNANTRLGISGFLSAFQPKIEILHEPVDCGQVKLRKVME